MASKSGKQSASKTASKSTLKSQAQTGLTYADAGVDIEAGDEMVGMIQKHMRRTYGPRVLGKHGAFAGCFRLDYNEKLFKRNYKDPVLVSCTDGVGTKVLLATELGIIDTVGQDLVAMNVNDMIVQGAEPLFFLDYIGTHKLEPEAMTQIVKGVADGCELAGCALLGGETAEMPDVYKKGDFDLAGFAVGVVELGKTIDGSRVEPGDVILGLSSSGVHSNGYTLVRAIIKKAKLELQKTYKDACWPKDQCSLGELLMAPTRIYAKQIVSLLNAYKVKQPISAMCHITGGGLPGNLPRVLHDEVNAVIDTNSWGIPPLFSFLQKKGRVAEDEMFRVFNMGIGYTLVVRPHFAEGIIKKLEKMGEEVFTIGNIIEGSGQVVLR